MPRSSIPAANGVARGRRSPAILFSVALIIGLAGFAWPVAGQPPRDFNACQLFTAEDAAAVLGGPAQAEAAKGKAPKVSIQCTYLRQEGARTESASASFRFYRTAAEALASLKETRLEVRGRPFIIQGQDAYWHPKAAHLAVAKGNSVVVLQVGAAADNEREPDAARKAAERLLPRLGS